MFAEYRGAQSRPLMAAHGRIYIRFDHFMDTIEWGLGQPVQEPLTAHLNNDALWSEDGRRRVSSYAPLTVAINGIPFPRPEDISVNGKPLPHYSSSEFNLLYKQIEQEQEEAKRQAELPLAILNSPILTADGTYEIRTIDLLTAQEIAQGATEILSAVGHETTAQILTDLLGVEVPVNRIQFEQQHGQYALVFKLNGRPPEGKILSREEIEAIGYTFKLLQRLP